MTEETGFNLQITIQILHEVQLDRVCQIKSRKAILNYKMNDYVSHKAGMGIH